MTHGLHRALNFQLDLDRGPPIIGSTSLGGFGPPRLLIFRPTVCEKQVHERCLSAITRPGLGIAKTSIQWVGLHPGMGNAPCLLLAEPLRPAVLRQSLSVRVSPVVRVGLP